MNILSKVKKFYDKTGGDMFADISAYASKGYVFITPQTFLLGKAVRSDLDIHPDNQWMVTAPNAWYVRTAIGKDCVKEFIERIPYPLCFVGWMRQLKQKPVKWYNFDQINRRK